MKEQEEKQERKKKKIGVISLGSEINSKIPLKQYVGVKVRLPVRELLRRIRSGRETDTNAIQGAIKEVSSKGSLVKSSSLPYSRKQQKPSKKKAKQVLKSLEDLDILAEILKDDLNQTNLCHEPPSPQCCSDSCFLGHPGEGNSRELKKSHLEANQNVSAVQSCSFFTKLHTSLAPPLVSLSLLNCKATDLPASNLLESSCLYRRGSTESSGQPQDTLIRSTRDLPELASRDVLHQSPPPEISDVGREATLNCPNPAIGLESSAPGSAPTDPNLSALSFFQFQLQREESLLGKIPLETLTASDDNGNWYAVFSESLWFERFSFACGVWGNDDRKAL
ncbi:uncharacterized protein LOC115074310 [Rhinatrema bivittatum]|uniref:uncharacterized protein LOC115074310 n=1 Tax=Rhinatrema bivittatum TaxID=194408 RepID=UPI00112ED2C5|nr:uncharacterized protein LOC115074310 [Rhinatrema bivittatum]